MPSDRSKSWGQRPEDDPAEKTEVGHPPAPAAWEDDRAGRRKARPGARRNDDETNVGGSLLPGDDFGLAKVFEQALAPAYVSDGTNDASERTEPVAFIPPPAAPSQLRRPGAPPPAPPTQPQAAPQAAPRGAPQADAPQHSRHAPSPSEYDLGPVEEFTISGLMPDELKALADAARQATGAANTAKAKNPISPSRLHADPPRTSRHDPDPLITGVLGAPGAFGRDPDDEMTQSAGAKPDMLERLRGPATAPPTVESREYHTFGAGLQRLDGLPTKATPKNNPVKRVGGGILELLDGSPEPASPTAPHPAPAPIEEADRPRRIATNRAGSMGRNPPQRAATPSPARSRSVVPDSRSATPRPAPSRSGLPRRDSSSGGSIPPREPLVRSRAQPPSGSSPRPSAGRAQDEEARIRAALASVSDDEHTSWVQLDDAPPPPPPERPAGNRPRASRPDDSNMPGVTPIGMIREEDMPAPDHEHERSLTMDRISAADELTRPIPNHKGADGFNNGMGEATVPNSRSSLGDETTVPAGPPPDSDDLTLPVAVPSSRATGGRTANRAQESVPAARVPPAKAPPVKGPPAKSPRPRGTSSNAKPAGRGKRPPVEISPLGDEKPESYRDGALPWIASAFAVMVVGAGLILGLLLLLWII